MPANKKYLSSSPWVKASKLLAGLIMGYVLASSIFLALAYSSSNYPEILITATWGIYILWVAFMIIPYFFEKAWKIWSIYLGSELILILIIIFSK